MLKVRVMHRGFGHYIESALFRHAEDLDRLNELAQEFQSGNTYSVLSCQWARLFRNIIPLYPLVKLNTIPIYVGLQDVFNLWEFLSNHSFKADGYDHEDTRRSSMFFLNRFGYGYGRQSKAETQKRAQSEEYKEELICILERVYSRLTAVLSVLLGDLDNTSVIRGQVVSLKPRVLRPNLHGPTRHKRFTVDTEDGKHTTSFYVEWTRTGQPCVSLISLLTSMYSFPNHISFSESKRREQLIKKYKTHIRSKMMSNIIIPQNDSPNKREVFVAFPMATVLESPQDFHYRMMKYLPDFMEDLYRDKFVEEYDL